MLIYPNAISCWHIRPIILDHKPYCNLSVHSTWNHEMHWQLKFHMQGCSWGNSARRARLPPWGEVSICLIGPWKFELPDGQEVEIMALICIDSVADLLELIRNTAVHVAEEFWDVWLSWYPNPSGVYMITEGDLMVKLLKCYCNNGGSKKHLLQAIADKQSWHENTFIKLLWTCFEPYYTQWIQKLLKMQLYFLIMLLPPQCAASWMFQTSPGALSYGRDMILDTSVIANLGGI